MRHPGTGWLLITAGILLGSALAGRGGAVVLGGIFLAQSAR